MTRDRWTEGVLGDVVSHLADGSHNPPQAAPAGGIPMYSARNIGSRGIDLSEAHRLISREDFDVEDARTQVKAGDVLLTIVGTIGRACLVRASDVPFALQRSVAVIRPKPVLLGSFLCRWLQSPATQRFFEENARGTAQKGVYLATLRSTPVAFPSTAKQQRIVDAIEAHSSRLDAAIASLTRAKANVKRARATVLKAAVEGRLVPTEAALACADDRDYEPASALLSRTLTERRARWAENGGKGKYKDPISQASVNDEPLPEGWTWATVDQVAIDVQYGTSAKCSEENLGVPVLRMGNIVDGRIDFTNLKYLPPDHAEFPGQLLKPGELLFNRTNSPELVGKSAVYEGAPPKCACASYLIRVELANAVLPHYLKASLNSPRGRAWVKTVVVQQVGQANVNGSKLKAHTFPLPPLAEQRRIVAEIDRRLSVLDALDATLDANLARCAKLRQSILKRAFEGQLVRPDAPKSKAPQLPLFMEEATQ